MGKSCIEQLFVKAMETFDLGISKQFVLNFLQMISKLKPQFKPKHKILLLLSPMQMNKLIGSP